MSPQPAPVPFRLDAAARDRAVGLFNARGEIEWFRFAGALHDDVAEIRFGGGAHRGLQGGGGTQAVNGGVIAAGFDAVAVLTGLGHYETDTVVTVDLHVQFLALAPLSPDLAWRGWATRTTRSLCFVQAALGDGRAVFATASGIVKPV